MLEQPANRKKETARHIEQICFNMVFFLGVVLKVRAIESSGGFNSLNTDSYKFNGFSFICKADFQ
jgi:hypothetical protein